MKKYSLLKALGICFFVFVVLSFILPAGSFTSGEFTKATTDPVGIFEWFSAPMNTIVNYGMYGIVFLLIGGLYGVFRSLSGEHRRHRLGVSAFSLCTGYRLKASSRPKTV